MKEKPELAEVISPKISDLSEQFGDLEDMTKEKGERLFDANREVLIHQTCDDIDSWMNDLEKQIESADVGSDLASVNILMQKQQVSLRFGVILNCLYSNFRKSIGLTNLTWSLSEFMDFHFSGIFTSISIRSFQMIETQMAVKARQVSDLETQATILEKAQAEPEKIEEIKQKKSAVEERFQKLKEPLVMRQKVLEKNKEAFQV